jgi:NAD-dependent deacetylase
LKVRSTKNEYDSQDWQTDLVIGDTCSKGHQLRPDIVWFGEAVPLIETAIEICQTADVLLIIGTSMQVYPAASIMHYVNSDTKIFYIDPKPAMDSNSQVTVIAKSATLGVQEFIELL